MVEQQGEAMKANVGGIDRGLRIALGLALIVLAATQAIGWWGWLGILPLLSGLLSFCPLYTLVGLNSCPVRRG